MAEGEGTGPMWRKGWAYDRACAGLALRMWWDLLKRRLRHLVSVGVALAAGLLVKGWEPSALVIAAYAEGLYLLVLAAYSTWQAPLRIALKLDARRAREPALVTRPVRVPIETLIGRQQTFVRLQNAGLHHRDIASRSSFSDLRGLASRGLVYCDSCLDALSASGEEGGAKACVHYVETLRACLQAAPTDEAATLTAFRNAVTAVARRIRAALAKTELAISAS